MHIYGLSLYILTGKGCVTVVLQKSTTTTKKFFTVCKSYTKEKCNQRTQTRQLPYLPGITLTAILHQKKEKKHIQQRTVLNTLLVLLHAQHRLVQGRSNPICSSHLPEENLQPLHLFSEKSFDLANLRFSSLQVLGHNDKRREDKGGKMSHPHGMQWTQYSSFFLKKISFFNNRIHYALRSWAMQFLEQLV